jgi:hypothetical protein
VTDKPRNFLKDINDIPISFLLALHNRMHIAYEIHDGYITDWHKDSQD